MPNKLNLKTQGGISGGFRGSHIQKSGLSKGWTDWHQMWFTSANSSGNGHRLNTICPSTLGGGLGGHKFKNQGKIQTAGPIGTKFGTHVYIHLGMDIRQTSCPERHRGTLGGGLGGHTFKGQGKLSNGWTDWHQRWFSSADSSGNGHRLYTSRPSIPQGGMSGGVLGGHKFKSLEKLSKGWTDWHQICTPLWIHLGMDIG